jgi:hypothetical protein
MMGAQECAGCKYGMCDRRPGLCRGLQAASHATLQWLGPAPAIEGFAATPAMASQGTADMAAEEVAAAAAGTQEVAVQAQPFFLGMAAAAAAGTQSTTAGKAAVHAWILTREMLMQGATESRRLEKEDYEAKHVGIGECIDVLGSAILELKYQDPAVQQHANLSLVQIKGMPLMPRNLKEMVDAFLKHEQAETPAHGFKSDVIKEELVAMLEKAHKDFIDRHVLGAQARMNRDLLYHTNMAHWSSQVATCLADQQKTGD